MGDRITLTLTVAADRVSAVETHRELIAGEVLATTLTVTEGEDTIELTKA